jgi:hypothetical protein
VLDCWSWVERILIQSSLFQSLFDSSSTSRHSPACLVNYETSYIINEIEWFVWKLRARKQIKNDLNFKILDSTV